MNKNPPIAEDVVNEEIRDFLLDFMDKNPEKFYGIMARLSQLAKLPTRTMKLIFDLTDAVPFEVKIIDDIQQQNPTIFACHETVCRVTYLDDEGGIAVELEGTENFKESRMISITMVEMPLKHPLRKRVNEYCRKRRKKLLRRQF